MSSPEIPGQSPSQRCPAENYGRLTEICGRVIDFTDPIDGSSSVTCWAGLPEFPCLDPDPHTDMSPQELNGQRGVVAHYQKGVTLEEQIANERIDSGLGGNERLPVEQPPRRTLLYPCQVAAVALGLATLPTAEKPGRCQYTEDLGAIRGTLKCAADLQPAGELAASANNPIGDVCLRVAALEQHTPALDRFSADPLAYGD